MPVDVVEPPADRPENEPPTGPALTFPDLPRLGLDQLLSQLVDRAREVLGTQGRLRGLLRANQLITGDLALPLVLRHIAEAARELVGARYAALGVISPAGGLAEFVHAGMPAADVERIGQLPQGKGLLGALIDDPHPIRLERIAGDDRSTGFPSGHPPMGSFLGVPIRIRDEVFGNLYLAESDAGSFSPEDEELAKALAATAAVAIENARLYASARTRGEWLEASTAITRQLLAPAPVGSAEPLLLIAERSRGVADADLVAIFLPHPDLGGAGDLVVEVAVGTGAGDLSGACIPVEGTMPGRVFRRAQQLRADHPRNAPGSVSALDVIEVGPLLAVPLEGSSRVHGVLWMARLRGRAAFTAAEADMAAAFANQAAVAIELAEARAEQQRAALLDDRDRIAAELHDSVIQRVFTAGMALQSTAAQLGPGRHSDQVLVTVAELDAVISRIRSSVFELHDLPGAARSGVRGRILDQLSHSAHALGSEPAVRFAGPLEGTASQAVVDDLTAVLGQALTGIARQADSRAVEVQVEASTDLLTLRLRDDGTGLIGLAHDEIVELRHRAQRHGGTCTVERGDPSGAVLQWAVPAWRG